jgi:hypothetical protein
MPDEDECDNYSLEIWDRSIHLDSELCPECGANLAAEEPHELACSEYEEEDAGL